MYRKNRNIRFEYLEPRQMMAGDVVATLINGSLYLNEAAHQAGRDNGVRISQLADGNIRVEGTGATMPATRVNGAPYQDFRVTGGLFVSLGAGKDQVSFASLGPKALFQDVVIDVGTATAVGDADRDQVSVANLEARGSLSIYTGASDDHVSVMTTKVGDGIGIDRLTVRTGTGADYLMMKTNVGIRGDADLQTFDSAAENDGETVYFDQNVWVQKNLFVRTGGGDDYFFASTPSGSSLSLQVDGSAWIEMGAGNDRVFMAGADIGYVTQGALSILMGAGADVVEIDNRYYSFYHVKIQTFDSAAEGDADVVKLQHLSLFGSLNVELGGGADQFVVLGDGPIGMLINATVRVDAGTGDDFVQMTGTSIGGISDGVHNLTVYTGAGSDTVSLDLRATPGGISRQHVGGTVEIQTYETLEETDTDTVRVYDGMFGRDVFARLGAGDDVLEFAALESVQGDVDVNAGAGNDTAAISGYVVDHLMARMGDGNDVLNLGKVWAWRLVLLGENGVDSLTKTQDTKSLYLDQIGWEYVNGRRVWFDPWLQPISGVTTKAG